MSGFVPLRVLSLQPFYGGSHRQFIDGWIQHSRHDWTTLALPDRFWKWRMRHSAIWFANQISQLDSQEKSWDIMLTTDMVNLAELQGLLLRGSSPHSTTPAVLYFHENQFAYPSRFADDSNEYQRDQHFAFTNFVSALAATEVWYNSAFNHRSLIDGLKQQANQWPDHVPTDEIAVIEQSGLVFPPGIETLAEDLTVTARLARFERAKRRLPLRLIWAARWEHDKRPEALLQALRLIQKQQVPFRISVLGQRYRQIPNSLHILETEFSEYIDVWGFLESREDYYQALLDSDVFVATAIHEFFGIAVAEAIAAGLRPALPARLAYPELLNRPVESASGAAAYLYSGPDASVADDAQALANHLVQVHELRLRDPTGWLVSDDHLQTFRNDLSWHNRALAMDERLSQLV